MHACEYTCNCQCAFYACTHTEIYNYIYIHTHFRLSLSLSLSFSLHNMYLCVCGCMPDNSAHFCGCLPVWQSKCFRAIEMDQLPFLRQPMELGAYLSTSKNTEGSIYDYYLAVAVLFGSFWLLPQYHIWWGKKITHVGRHGFTASKACSDPTSGKGSSSSGSCWEAQLWS